MDVERMASQTRLKRWRPGIVISAFFWLLAAGFVFIAIPVFVATATSIGEGIAWVALSLALIASFVGLTNTYVDLYPDRVELGGWLRRPKRVPLAQLTSVTPGNFGLEFDVEPSGGTIGPALVGAKGLATRVLNIRMRGDRIAERIMLEVERVRSDTDRVGPPASQWLRRLSAPESEAPQVPERSSADSRYRPHLGQRAGRLRPWRRT